MKLQLFISKVYCLYGFVFFMLVIAPIKLAQAEDIRDKNNQIGFLVLAADRGFVGNEEIRKVFDIFAKGRNASLVFITDDRTQQYLKSSLHSLLKYGAERIVVMPLFISASTPRFQHARTLLETEKPSVPVSYALAYGESYFAVEYLTDKLRTIEHPAATSVLIVGYGATDNDSRQKMHADWQHVAAQASIGFGFASMQVFVANDRNVGDTDDLKQALDDFHSTQVPTEGDSKKLVIPFHFGPKLDSMMSFDAKLTQLLPPEIRWFPGGNLDSKNLITWLQREANQNQQLVTEDIGVVFLAHGADFNWNETMRKAVKPLTARYKIEFVFSMADQETIQHAIQKLEQRGAKAAVIVRVFAMEESFRDAIEHMVGLDIEETQDSIRNITQIGHQEIHSGKKASPSPRIRSSLPIRTVGGVGTSPLFAAALYDRALSLSQNPARETVILVGHGSYSDDRNEQWNKSLEILADYIRMMGGKVFRDIQVATWREDWPDKREPWIKKVRTMIEDAKLRGDDVIVIPARTTGQGHEKEYLSGLDYKLGSGFAPHPLFIRWVEEQIKAGAEQFN